MNLRLLYANNISGWIYFDNQNAMNVLRGFHKRFF